MEGRYDTNRLPGNIRREGNDMGILDTVRAQEVAKQQAPTMGHGLASRAVNVQPRGLSMEEMVQAGIMSPEEYQMNIQDRVAQSEMNARPQLMPKPVTRRPVHPEVLGNGLGALQAQAQGLGPGEQAVYDQGFAEANAMDRR